VCGIDENKDEDESSESSISYSYKVTYRVGCPTCKFDAHNTFIDCELLDASLRPICKTSRFMLTDLTGARLSLFKRRLHVTKPLPSVGGVRVSHTNGFPGSGVFLFDVLVAFKNASNSSEEVVESDQSTHKNRIKNQRVKIFAYITDSPKIYMRLIKTDQVRLPPLACPRASQVFWKALIWLCCAQTVGHAIYLLGNAIANVTFDGRSLSAIYSQTTFFKSSKWSLYLSPSP